MDKHNSYSAITLFIFCVLFVFSLTAQDSGRLLLKPDFLAMMQHIPTFQPRIEYKVRSNGSVQFTPGFCYGTLYTTFQSPDDFDYDALNLKGFSAKLEYRYYLQDSNSPMQGFYIAPEIAYRSVFYRQGRYFRIYTSTYNYEKLMEYTVNKTNYAYHLKVGYQEKITNRIYIDVFAGIGRRIIVLKNNLKIPDDALYIEESSFSTRNLYWGYKGTKTRFSVAGSVLIGFVF